MTIESTSDAPVLGRCPILHDFDPFTAEYQADPAAALRKARRDTPIFYSPEMDYYVVTRYADIRAIFRDTDSFSATIALDPVTPLSERAVATLIEHHFDPGPFLVNEDEPTHLQRRRKLAEPLNLENVRRWDPQIRAIVNDRIDRFVRRGRADLVAELMWEVPATVGLMFMGVPEEEIATARKFAVGQVMFAWGRPSEQDQVAGCEGMGLYFKYAQDLVARLKENPDGPGWVQFAIRAAQDAPELLDDRFLASMMMSGSTAAHETTTNAGAGAFLTLLRNREAWDEICRNPSLIPNTVEECLRYAPSVMAWRRTATKSVVVNGVEIPEGAKVLLVSISGNFDESQFPEPEKFDIRRKDAKRHFAFGFGSHTCLGAPLARLELRIILEEITRRLPHARLVPDQKFEYLPNTSFRGPQSLLIEWDPVANPVPADRP